MTSWNALLILLQLHLLLRGSFSEVLITAHNDFGWDHVDPEIADELDWSKHPCRRTCKDGAPPMDCHYTFKLESYYTMSKACYNCPFNIEDCFRMHCIPADGIKRPILVVNRQMPGPSIEVCQGDRIIVDIINLLHSGSTTMHWHGQHHVQTPYMDGVPYVSQCPIPPGSSFHYDFIATEAGTHFWHSHLGFQRGDGVFGPLIVRAPPERDWHRDLYDIDEHTLLVLDWTHELGIDTFLSHHHADGDNKPPNLLINGLGRFSKSKSGNETSEMMPIVTYTVKQDMRYRFRLINAEFLNCPVEISIDNHTLYVVSSDGRDIEPIEATSLVSYAGERFDFIVEANQEIDNYWIRLRGLMDCDERFTRAYQTAILRYEGAAIKNPEGNVTYDRVKDDSQEVQVNALNEGTESNRSISVPLFRAMDPNDRSNTQEADYQFYISYDFYEKDNPHYHRKKHYEFKQVKNKKQQLRTPQLNHISMKLPSFPLLSQRDLITADQFCNDSTIRNCKDDYCACTHVLQVKLNSVVEVILVDEGFAFDANHPFHLHGYQFRVVAMERVGKNVTVEKVKKLDREGMIRRNFDRAPLKDTVTVPDGGYTVIRFYANNPGYWLFHCHIEFHAEVGMSLVFKVGEHSEMLPVPHDFPQCGNWRPSNTWTKKNDSNPSLSEGEATTRKNWLPNNSTNEISGNSIDLFLKLLPRVLQSLNITSSAHTLVAPRLFLYTCIFISLIYRPT